MAHGMLALDTSLCPPVIARSGTTRTAKRGDLGCKYPPPRTTVMAIFATETVYVILKAVSDKRTKGKKRQIPETEITTRRSRRGKRGRSEEESEGTGRESETEEEWKRWREKKVEDQMTLSTKSEGQETQIGDSKETEDDSENEVGQKSELSEEYQTFLAEAKENELEALDNLDWETAKEDDEKCRVCRFCNRASECGWLNCDRCEGWCCKFCTVIKEDEEIEHISELTEREPKTGVMWGCTECREDMTKFIEDTERLSAKMSCGE